MKLLELYEDLFQYVCRLNRAAKTPAHPEYARVRSEVKDLDRKSVRYDWSSDVCSSDLHETARTLRGPFPVRLPPQPGGQDPGPPRVRPRPFRGQGPRSEERQV